MRTAYRLCPYCSSNAVENAACIRCFSAGGKYFQLLSNSASALRTVSDKEFLRKAWREDQKRNMLSKGLDNVTVRAFKARLDDNLSEISTEIREGKYIFNKL